MIRIFLLMGQKLRINLLSFSISIKFIYWIVWNIKILWGGVNKVYYYYNNE